MLALAVVLLLCYLIGSIPTSLWVGKMGGGVDIRKHGSGNAGATNTFRILGWKYGSLVLAFDFAKGFICTAVISQLAYEIGSGPISVHPNWDVNSFLLITCGAVAVVGHMFPIYADFSGGKGAATAAGMLYGIEPISISITVVIFLIVIFSTYYISLGSITASIVYPLSQVVLRYIFGWDIDGSIIIFSSILGLGIIIKHKGNIKRLFKGTENKIESFKPSKGRIHEEEEEG
ncbi:MAG: glycerol-3-phosphate 1-O-acyltransferase PlsY [Bacteroidetes bacterium]|jgi:glycerol-3-phosphate acyltransferase PlsY|nr:glycerol-3-phosphate 1-O-acyltransferase PlsY [Bacteroidota bacterium]